MRKSAILVAIGVLITLITAGGREARAGENFAPQGLETFQNNVWSGLTLGVSTQENLKKQFSNGRGKFDASVELKQPKDAPIRIDALFPNKDKKAILDGICLTFRAPGADAAPILTALGEGAETRYLTGRQEDWKIVSYPQRGVLLVIVNDKAQQAFLGTGSRVAAALGASAPGLTTEVTSIAKQYDPNANKSKIMEFGAASVTYNVQGIRLDNQDKDKQRIEERMKKATAGGYIRYVPGASGSYSLTITVNYDAEKGGSIDISVSIQGDAPYGRVSGSGGGYLALPSVSKGGVGDVYGYAYAVKLAEAMSKAEEGVGTDVRTQGPPPIETARLVFCQKMLEQFRASSPIK